MQYQKTPEKECLLERKEVNFGKVSVGRCYLVMMLEGNFVLIKKLFKGIIKGIFGDKNKISVLFYFIHR